MLEKYLELSEIYQQLSADNKLLQDGFEKLNNENESLKFSIKEKDLTIADLVVENNRLKDILKLKIKDLEDCKKGYRIPEEENKGFLDRIFRGAK